MQMPSKDHPFSEHDNRDLIYGMKVRRDGIIQTHLYSLPARPISIFVRHSEVVVSNAYSSFWHRYQQDATSYSVGELAKRVAYVTKRYNTIQDAIINVR